MIPGVDGMAKSTMEIAGPSLGETGRLRLFRYHPERDLFTLQHEFCEVSRKRADQIRKQHPDRLGVFELTDRQEKPYGAPAVMCADPDLLSEWRRLRGCG